MKKNDEIVLEIIDVSTDGSGIGKYDGFVVFVPLTAVSDIVKVKILKVKKNYAFGKVIEILTASEDRIEIDCPFFNKCGGCVFRHINYNSELKLKEKRVAQTIKRIGKSNIIPQKILYCDNTDFYRNKAQFPINLNGEAGFYAFHSHRIIACKNCKLQSEIFSKIVDVCEKWIKQNNISVYDEIQHKGLLRHLYLRIAQKTNEVMLTLVINGDTLPQSNVLIKNLIDKFPEIKSIQININKKDTNVILGDKCVCIYGSEYITDILCDVSVRLSPLSFYQVNRNMAEILYKKAKEYASPSGLNILDLYCGAGTIGLSMADEAKSVIGVEVVPQAVEDAKFNAKQNNIRNARFICSDATNAAQLLAEEGINADVVIVDPPRKGCSSELINTICNKFNPNRVVYVSCDVSTLARDIEIFDKYGYKLIEYTPVDLFPRTAHVETVALLLNSSNM